MIEVRIQVTALCGRCVGTGLFQPPLDYDYPPSLRSEDTCCPACDGTGRLPGEITLEDLAQILGEMLP